MAFLDNSGDIILDAVLTDTGRLRLAQGDGSFKITKFALGDDEINYGNYNKDHASGSAYYDLDILQTPVLEAFTNNTSNLNTKLMSIARTNILFMPELLLNKKTQDGTSWQPLDSYMYYRKDVEGDESPSPGVRYIVAVDNTTWEVLNYNIATTTGAQLQGALMGFDHAGGTEGGLIRVDQGLATNQINPAAGMDSDLVETQYIIELDYRLGRIAHQNASKVVDVNFIDDDNIASYYIAGNQVKTNTNTTATGSIKDNDTQVFAGPRGTSLLFRIHASTELQYSTYLFEQLGQTFSGATLGTKLGIDDGASGPMESNNVSKAYVIDTVARVIGANTGYRIDIPIRYLKIE